ncbi:AT-rich interactive domain-containing protein 2 isoform X2 [Chironomus tepperi]|uniref:AT-rich interactive domain-containing protein 2 isoform X2 n=1 Tax=Chironomus tepperi TaxID=113505 RepID=UPI00391EE3B6
MSMESPVVKEEETRSRQTRKNKNSILSLTPEQFYKDLLKFHESRGTPIVKFPRLAGNGKLSEIDLYKLYDLVISRGGWMKINSKNEWGDIEKEIGFPEKCVNSELALKHIYIRYFDKYERYNFLGEEKERIDEDEEENRHKRWSARTLHSIPQSYNYNHHNISNSIRETNKLSTNLYQSSEYDKLSMALLSPLPNEQDFAINVLTLMSNECKQTLRLGRCPRLIGNLLAHAGCYEHFNLREMFHEFYSTVRGHSQEKFWKDLLSHKPDLFYLAYEDTLSNEEIRSQDDMNQIVYGTHEAPSKDVEEFSFLALGRGLGTQEYMGQRVHQVTTIIRNLSFFEENGPLLANDKTLLRFLVMLANCRWNNLHMMALDVLGNIAQEITLKDPFSDLTSRHLFGLICDEIEGRDRGTIVGAMEILSKLCAKEDNEEFLLKHLKKENYDQVCTYLLVPDMMLLVYALECVYSLTSLGEKACNSIVDFHGMIETLVSMITLEAQSLGPDSCIQMKVVETVPTRQVFYPPARPQHMMPQNVIIQKGNIPDQQRSVYQSPTKFVQPQQMQPQVHQSDSQGEFPNKADVLMKQKQAQMLQENEQFALAWIRNNFELSPSLMVKIEEHDMYRMYLNACTKIGRKGVISQVHFPRCVRSIFGGTVGPNPGNSTDPEKIPQYYCGIKPRAMTLPQISNDAQKPETIIIHPANSSPTVKQEVKTEDSYLVAQLSGNKSVAATTSAGQSLLQQALSTSQAAQPSQSPITTTSASMATSGGTSTSLIKSLLANKVTTPNNETNSTAICTTTTMSMSSTSVNSTNVNSLHQVAQRQQITQKQKLLTEQLNSSAIANQTNQPPKMVVANQQQNVMKIGPSTIIKPGPLPTNNVIANENKPVVVTTNDPPPLAPLSTQSNKAPTIVQTISINPNSQEKVLVSQKLTANKMLVDLLDKKGTEPPHVFGGTTIKRKAETESDVPTKKQDIETQRPEQIVSPSPKAADLYAKLAGSILEDEDEDELDEIEKSVPAKIIEKKIIEMKPQANQIIGTTQVQRQIIMGPNNQVILSPNNTHQTTATIKTDSAPTIIQQPAPTQYILATNQQGQTYVVAQQPMSQPQMPQTVLLAQTPGQTGAQGKTIIILQQPQGQQIQVQPGQQQKIIMTPSGQQVIYSSPVQRQVIGQPIIQTLPQQSTANTIIQNTATNTQGRKIVITNVDGTAQGGTKIMQQTPTKIVQHTTSAGTSQQTLQAIAQGQNIIVQKGQKFQIGSTQISQVMTPTQQQVQQSQQLQIQAATQQIHMQQGSNQQIHIQQANKQIQIQQSSQQNPVTQTVQIQSQSNVMATSKIVQKIEPNPPAIQQKENIEIKKDEHAESFTSAVNQQESSQIKVENTDSNESQQGAMIKMEETSETQKDKTPSSSGSSSPSPNQNKQTISIQIPVPQSQLVGANAQQYTIKIIPSMDTSIKVKDEDVEPSWLYICDWRGCPKKKFNSANEVYLHACSVHCPSLDSNPDLYCQWGGGNSLCDNLPRKRFSLMTHILDRHCTADAFKLAAQKRIANLESGQQPTTPKQPYPVTLYRQPNAQLPNDNQSNLANGPTNIQNAGVAAMQAIKRHSIDFIHLKDVSLQDETEGTVTKSIRLTAALILRNLATYSSTAKRALRYHESHLSQIALSNLESNRVIAQVLYECTRTEISPFARP